MDIQEDQAYCGMRVCFKSLNSMLESSAAIPKSVKVFLKDMLSLKWEHICQLKPYRIFSFQIPQLFTIRSQRKITLKQNR